MDTQTIKEKILSGDMADEELKSLLERRPQKQKGSLLKTLLKGFIDAYTAPSMWRITLQAVLILLVIVATLLLAYWKTIDATVAAVLLAFVLGFLFGKFK